MNFTTLFDLLGTFAFAISGIRLASGKRVDWFGAFIIGFVTATGGGTIRDLFLDYTPFWMENPIYIIAAGAALVSVLVFRGKVFRWGKALFIFDTIGLALFTVAALGKSLEAGFPFWVCIIMGTITGCLGGVIRDVLLNEVPLLLRKDIYALACIAGGAVYFLGYELNLARSVYGLMALLTVITIRIIAIKYHIQVPILNMQGKDETPTDRAS